MITLRAIADLCAYSGPDEVVRVLGYHSINDGGGGTFVWRLNSMLSEGIHADNGIYFNTTQASGIISKGNGLWERLDRDQVSVKWYGARGNGTHDDTQAIQSALDSGAMRVYIPYTGKGYSITGIEIPDGVSLIGCSGISTGNHGDQPRIPKLLVIPGPEHFGVRSRENTTGGSLEDIAISGAAGCAFGLCVSTENFRTSNVMVHGFTDAAGVIMGHNRRSVHTGLHISRCGIGLLLDGAIGTLHAVVFTGLTIRLCTAGIIQREHPDGLPGSGNVFTGAIIEAIGYSSSGGVPGAISAPCCIPDPEDIAGRFKGGIHMEGNFQAAFVGLCMDAVNGTYIEYERATGAGALSLISCSFGLKGRRSIPALSGTDADLFQLSGTPVHISGCSFRYHATETSAPPGMDHDTNDFIGHQAIRVY